MNALPLDFLLHGGSHGQWMKHLNEKICCSSASVYQCSTERILSVYVRSTQVEITLTCEHCVAERFKALPECLRLLQLMGPLPKLSTLLRKVKAG